MGYPGNPVVTGTISTSALADTYPTHYDILGYGGHMSVETVADRDAIPTARRKFGMFVTVYDDAGDTAVYILANTLLGGADDVITNNSNWIEFSTGGGGGVSDGDKGDITISGSGATYTVDTNITKTWTGKHTFTPNVTNAGLNIGSYAGDPSSLVANDLYYNSTTNNLTFVHGGGALGFALTAATTHSLNEIPYFFSATFPFLTYNSNFTHNATTGVTSSRILSASHSTEAGIRVNSISSDPVSLSNGYMWYNSTSNELKARINGASVALGSGGGLTGTGSVDNALLRADGTGGSTLQSSSIIISDTADITLGTSSLAGNRTLTVEGNGATHNLTLSSKGAGSVMTLGLGSLEISLNGTGVAGYMYPQSNGMQFVSRSASSGYYMLIVAGNATGSGTTGGALTLIAGSGSGTNNNGGHIAISGGDKTGTGTNGNISLHAVSGSYGSGERVLFIANATTIPSGTPSGGGILYVEAGALKYKGSSGFVTTIAIA